jgi:hypothetical protein
MDTCLEREFSVICILWVVALNNACFFLTIILKWEMVGEGVCSVILCKFRVMLQIWVYVIHMQIYWKSITFMKLVGSICI